MPRLPRVIPAGYPQHLIQRGNNREVCFFEEADYLAYLHWLQLAAHRYRVQVHGYVLMTNHVHLLVTPEQDGAIAALMQYLGRHYVHYINKKYHRTGTLWERRYRASLIDSEAYLVEVLRYIDLNPVRASMVNKAEDYRWSSVRVHLGLDAADWLLPHPESLGLGTNQSSRVLAYQALLNAAISPEQLESIRVAIHTGQALGGQPFIEQIELAQQRRIHHDPPRRKPKLGESTQDNHQLGLEFEMEKTMWLWYRFFVPEWMAPGGPLHEETFTVSGHSLGGYLAAAVKHEMKKTMRLWYEWHLLKTCLPHFVIPAKAGIQRLQVGKDTGSPPSRG